MGTKVWYKQCIKYPNPNHIPETIISVPMYHTSDVYTVKCLSTYGIQQLFLHRLHCSDTTASPINSPSQQYNTLLAWIKNGTNDTIILNAMPNPKRVTQVHDKYFNWAFKTGCSKIIQPSLFSNSTRIHILWLTIINCFKGTPTLIKLSLKKESKSFKIMCHNTY